MGRDAWFWKGIARIASIRSENRDSMSILEEGKTYLQRSRFSRDEMVRSLVALMPTGQLFDMFVSIQCRTDRNASSYKDLSDLFLSAAKETITRQQIIAALEQQIETIQSLLAKASGADRRRLYEEFFAWNSFGKGLH